MLDPHPSLPEFDYIKPKTLAEASQFLADHAGEARPLLGGTDIFVRMRDGFWKDQYLVDVKGLDGTNEISFDPAKGLTIGAGVSMNRVSAHPDVKVHYAVLAEAVDSVASYQLRSRATIVGNICNASPAGDTIGACILLGGVLNVHGLDGKRQEPLSTFFKGPGSTVLKAGDVVVSIELPLPPKGLQGTYLKLGRNKSSDLSIVGVTAIGYPDADTVSGYRVKVALASVAPTPLVVDKVEEIMAAKPITEDVIAEAAEAAFETASPIDDVRGGAKYRKLMSRNLSKKALTVVWEKLGR
ncbi:MAG: xanthine dehydrogenase family protein subunit M [Anaerolineales bacterium]|nr:xanthine dehydrogenase family protein subunit M [Chloroflexota bacterium]MBL6982790.1 xanthine dehydrogenase family protein subunit M [Anaerolineales bacterium]